MFNGYSMPMIVERVAPPARQTRNVSDKKPLEIDIKLVQIATLFFGFFSAYQLQRNTVAIRKWVPVSLSCAAGASHLFLHNREGWTYQKKFASLAAALFALHAFHLTSSSNKSLSFAKFQFAWLLLKVQTSSASSQETTHTSRNIKDKVNLSDLNITYVDSQSTSVCITALLALTFFNTKEFGFINYLGFNLLSLARNYASLTNLFGNEGSVDSYSYIKALVCSFVVYTIYTYLISSEKLPEVDSSSQLPSFSYYKTFGFFLTPLLALVESYKTFKDIATSEKEEYVLKLIPAILAIYTAFAFYKKKFSWISVKMQLSLPLDGVKSAHASVNCLTHKTVLEKINSPSEIAQFLAEKVNSCVKKATSYRQSWIENQYGVPHFGSRELHLVSSETMFDNSTFKGINVSKLLMNPIRIGTVWFHSGIIEGVGWVGRWAPIFHS